MHRAWLLACGALTVALACGGRGTLLVGDDTSGSASGGAGQGGSGVNSSTANVVTATSVVTTAVTSTAVSSSTGVGMCDGSGDCMQCGQCAQNGPCADEIDACANDPQCNEFVACFEMCQGMPGCFPQCAQMHPEGAQLYIAAVQCILCDECPIDCEQFTPPMLCEL